MAIDFSGVIEKKLNKTRCDFGKCQELTEEWEKVHAEHTPTRYRHTILKNGKGTKFECVKCYLCRAMARKKISTTQAFPEQFIKPSRKNKPWKKKINKEVTEFEMLPEDLD